jgi:hypothetical protein
VIELRHISAMDEQVAYERFRAACSIDTDRSIADLICTTTYLNGELFGFAGYEYLIDPVEDTHPWQVIIKPAQKGASEIFARKMFALLYRYGQTPHYYQDDEGIERCIWGIDGIYSFPDDNSLQKFSKDRILTDIIKASPSYHAAMKESESEAASQIGLFNSFAYLLGRKSDTSNQSVPAEIIMIDESDRPLNGDRKVRAQLYGRTRNARIFGNSHYKGLTINYGTPTLPDEDGATDLLDGMWVNSDQHEYTVKCHKCNAWQVVTYPDSIAHFYEPGQKPGKDPYWMCLKCKRPIDWSRIGLWRREEPRKVHNAKWVAKYPERTKDGGGTRGYRIPFASGRDSAKQLLVERDTKWKNSKADFYNLGLGIAYRDNSIGLGEEDFVRAASDQVPWGFYDPSIPHIMGVDQGMYVVIARLKEGSQTDINPQGIWQTVYCVHVKDSEAFSKIIKVNDQLQIYEGEFAKLVKKWNPDVIVMDHLPNTASSEAEANIFKEIMWLCDSKGNAGMSRLKIDEEDTEGNIIHRLLEHKHLAIDEYFEQVRGQRWEYPLYCDDPEFRTFKTHTKNVKKLVDQEKHTFIYESFGADHYAQAGKLCCEAAEVYNVVKPRSKRAGILLISGFKSLRG